MTTREIELLKQWEDERHRDTKKTLEQTALSIRRIHERLDEYDHERKEDRELRARLEQMANTFAVLTSKRFWSGVIAVIGAVVWFVNHLPEITAVIK